ncbi:DUF2975 domain-containing protein [bacterium]|nr:MAG: DUF2975 domain-containing protein [bacterium]
MKKGSTLFLKLVIIFMGLVALGVIGVAIPIAFITGERTNEYVPFWILIYLTAIPFFMALLEGMRLLGFIDKNTAFSNNSVAALGKIKIYAIVMTVLYLACLPWVFKAADADDSPGMVLMWTAFSCAPLVIAVFAALLKTLLKNVIDIKAENDLTV